MQACSGRRCDHGVLAFRGHDEQAATVVVMIHGGQLRFVFRGADKTTVAVSDAAAAALIETISVIDGLRNPQLGKADQGE